MAVPAPNIRWRGANPNNFTVGRQVARDGRYTMHHVVGSRESAVIVFNNPTRGASAHYVVGEDIIDQCVSINDTAWTDGNWDSNIRSITVEHEGGWDGNGPYSEGMYKNASHLLAWCRENYGINRFVRHRDVSNSATACPGGLDCERIWRDSDALIAQYSKPVAQPEWMQNRKIVDVIVYAQIEGLRIINLNDTTQFADSRVFARNTSFEIGSETSVGGVRYYISKSSTNGNIGNGIRASEVATTPYVAPHQTPPVPASPKWDDSLQDIPNIPMYVLRQTNLIDLQTGKPVVEKGASVTFNAGQIIADVSATTIVSNNTYYLTEYSYKRKIAHGIKAGDLTLEPSGTPTGTPANPDYEGRLSRLEKLVQKIVEFLKNIFKNWKD